jgi:hypothetical protein
MGDSAVNVAQAVEVLNQEPPLKPYIDLPRLAIITQEMVRDSLDSFVRRDARAAFAVCRRDDEVDALYRQLFRELLTYMAEDSEVHHPRAPSAAHARNYERIADHATNIGEDVIFFHRRARHPHMTPDEKANLPGRTAGARIARRPAGADRSATRSGGMLRCPLPSPLGSTAQRSLDLLRSLDERLGPRLLSLFVLYLRRRGAAVRSRRREALRSASRLAAGDRGAHASGRS